jgi:hypothetical protein
MVGAKGLGEVSVSFSEAAAFGSSGLRKRLVNAKIFRGFANC